ncbi:conserved hypothetical protein [Paecilomyces variotii No. 5]|uniref:Uncharacterized protein n=1 Tax=Byssochlamys spectabilis (strain No. 5 / NBRC 109023) TaxID=1356009 RepID=V5FZ50_BYSSN|nr:conserved hypothetical protein [Paecilomyces variotii No. 5]
MGAEKDIKKVDEKPSYLKGKEARNAIGANRGPLGVGDSVSEINVEHVESADSEASKEEKKKKKGGCMFHMRRFWFVWLVGLIILGAVALPILFLLIIPAIAQDVLNSSKLLLVSGVVADPKPDSVLLTVISALNLKGFTVKTDPLTLDLFIRKLSDEPFAKVNIPASTVHDNTTLGVTNQQTPLLNQQGWQQFVNNVLFLDKGLVSVRGNTNAYLGKLKCPVWINRDLETPMLGKFPGFTITNTTLLLPDKSDGTNLIANATLPNQSVLTIYFGKASFNILSGDMVIGNASIDNLVLKPGNQPPAPVRGILDVQKVIANLGSVLSTQADAIRHGYLNLTIKGTGESYNGEVIPYYDNALKQLSLTAQVSIVGFLASTIHNIIHGNGTNLLSGLTGNGGSQLSSLKALSDETDEEPDMSRLLSSNSTELFKKLLEPYADGTISGGADLSRLGSSGVVWRKSVFGIQESGELKALNLVRPTDTDLMDSGSDRLSVAVAGRHSMGVFACSVAHGVEASGPFNDSASILNFNQGWR